MTKAEELKVSAEDSKGNSVEIVDENVGIRLQI